MRFLAAVGFIVLSFAGCKNKDKATSEPVSVKNDLTGSSLTFTQDAEKGTVEITSSKNIQMIFHLPPNHKQVDTKKLEQVIKKFNFYQLDAGENQRWLKDIAGSTTEQKSAECEELQLDKPSGFLAKQHKDGSLYVEVKQESGILLSAMAKRVDSPGFCVKTWKDEAVMQQIISFYTDIHARFVAALGTEQESKQLRIETDK